MRDILFVRDFRKYFLITGRLGVIILHASRRSSGSSVEAVMSGNKIYEFKVNAISSSNISALVIID